VTDLLWETVLGQAKHLLLQAVDRMPVHTCKQAQRSYVDRISNLVHPSKSGTTPSSAPPTPCIIGFQSDADVAEFSIKAPSAGLYDLAIGKEGPKKNSEDELKRIYASPGVTTMPIPAPRAARNTPFTAF
jgi:hypothetical protein